MNKRKFPKVSVLITNFNKEKYILKALKSSLSQTYKNSEVLFLRTFMIVIVLICLNLYGIYRANFINNLDLKTLCRKSMKLSLKTN